MSKRSVSIGIKALEMLVGVCGLLTPLSCAAAMATPTQGGNLLMQLILRIQGMFYGTWFPVAVLLLVIAGIRMIVTTDESAANKAKSSIAAVVVGIMMIALSGSLVNILYQFNGSVIFNTAPSFNTELGGISEWLSAMAGIIGIAMIALATIRALASFGDEASYANVRTTLAQVIGGIVIIGANTMISNAVFNNNPNPLLNFLMGRLLIVLTLVGLITVGIVIYAGIRMVLNFGNEEAFTSGRSLIFRALGGLAVIGISFLLAEFVILTV